VAARTVDQRDERFPGTIHETVETIRRSGGVALAVPTDLSRSDDRHRLIETVTNELGPIDILVNNAAVTYFLPVVDFPESRFNLMFEVQVRAPFELSQLVLPGMRERKRGWILNISSGAARHPQVPPTGAGGGGRGGTVYGMVKAAMERFSSGLASEVYADGVAVNALSPSRGVMTPGVVYHFGVTDPAARIAEGTAEAPEVMAEAALALCSGDPSQLTGRVTYSQALLDELGRTPGALDPV
jgi:NAD(P)-dependent dehydrogenase (short-subunit alcohol dehydrogenase family)